MLASEYYKIQRSQSDDWFDAILDTDTRLFVDPFLVFSEKTGFWADAHTILIDHFNTCFNLVASSGRNRNALTYKKALALLMFREPKEMCLGYTSQGTGGLGGGTDCAKAIAEAIEDAIARGMISLQHFEELGIFNKGIGPDLISDMVCNVLKPKFIAYTQSIATVHGFQTEHQKVFPAAYDAARKSWSSGNVLLPKNPATNEPLLFVPSRFLRDLPTLNADDWWTAYEAERVRDDINYEVLGKVNKQIIVDTARQYNKQVESWTVKMESTTPEPYDLAKDPLGVYGWDKASRQFVESTPLHIDPPNTLEEFCSVIELVIAQFKKYVEQNGGWRLLWNDDSTEKNEDAAQLLFSGIAKSYCRANNIEVDREVELGRGPVDFKFSNGFKQRALLEVKKMHNGKFWDGMEAQLPSYCVSDDCKNGWFLALHYRDEGVSNKRVQDLPQRVEIWATTTGLRLRYGYVDARPKISASNLKSTGL